MSDTKTSVKVARGDTLFKIAEDNGSTLDEIIKANPQIRNPNVLVIGQRIALPRKTLPPKKFELTIRFENSWGWGPIGVRYEILVATKLVAKDYVSPLSNESTFEVSEGMVVTIKAQSIGQEKPQPIATFTAASAHPVIIMRIDSIKFPSLTELHPKSSPGKKSTTKPPPEDKRPDKDQGLPNQRSKDADGAAEHQVLPGECACARDLTIEELVGTFPSRKKKDLEPYLAPMNMMMATYGIDSCLRKAHILAQIGKESAYLRLRAEVLPKGKTEEGSYKGYKGRGLMQITFKANYAAYGKYKGEDFLGDNRIKLESYEYATDSAGWFWNYGKAGKSLSQYADENDLLYITSSINGAFNGFDDRAAIFKSAHKALNASKCKTVGNRTPEHLSFEKSRAYNDRDMAFGWALWSDPLSDKKGVAKNAAMSKAAYKRFLELNKIKPIKAARFHIKTTEQMVSMAEERSK